MEDSEWYQLSMECFTLARDILNEGYLAQGSCKRPTIAEIKEAAKDILNWVVQDGSETE